MNNLNKIAAISLLAFACFMAPSCKASAEGTEGEYFELTSIIVELEAEENLVITRGDNITNKQLKVLATYEDGSQKYVDGWELPNFKNGLIGLNQEVEVEYSEHSLTCTDSITVDVLYKFNQEPVYLPEGTDGSIGTAGRYVYFGDYPQSLKDSEVDVLEDRSIEVGENTYYLGSDGYYYAPVEKSGSTSYYLVQPMKWRILSETCTGTTDEGDNISGKLLLAEEIYSSSRFADPTGTNVYSESVVRQYLNHDFLETAFTSSAREFMIKPELNNGIHSGGPFPVLEAEISSDIRTDKVFILSMADVANADYGFGSPNEDGGRVRTPTAYILQVGIQLNQDTGKAWWWTRTPNGFSTKYKLPATYGVNSNGTLDATQHPINNGNRPGIVPAVVIR